MSESPYTFSSEPTGTHAIILSQVSPQTKVLDVGCAGGYLGEYLVEKKGCEMWGIEPNEESAKKARQTYKQVITGQIEKALGSGNFEGVSFDVIILGDVLEHLLDPRRVLQKIKKFLKPNGRFIISLPFTLGSSAEYQKFKEQCGHVKTKFSGDHYRKRLEETYRSILL